mgnify:FL=1
MIKFENVSFKYEEFKINDISFEIEKGEIIAITGNNASGKTTLIKLISGLLKNKKGTITINNMPIKKSDAKIGIIFQNPDNQIIFNSVYDDICFTLKNHNVKKEEFDERIDYALKMVDMLAYKNKETYTMSTGQKQRIAIANMLAIKPDIIIFDEASVYLDPTTKQALYKLFLSLKASGTTVIFTTNLLEEIVYADRVMLLNNGSLKAFMPTKDILNNLDLYRENGTYIPLKLQIIEKLKLNNYVDNDDILNAIKGEWNMFIFILLFIVFSLFIFITNNIYVLVGFTISNILLHFIFKISPKKALKNLFKIFFLIIIIFLFNLIFDNLINSLIVSYKVLIVANGAFIFSKVITPTRLANGFKQLFLPLKLFKVDTNNLALMLTIALNFIPIISYDITTLKQTLKARNVKLNLKTLFTQSHLLFVMFFANLFKRVDDLELVIRARGCC